VYHLDEPKVGAGSFSQYMVAKRAAEDLKVILTGHGGDEFFAGYPVFKAIFGRNNLIQLLFTSTFRELVVFFYFSVFSKFKKETKYFLPNIFSSNTLKVLLKDDFYNSFQDNSNCALELERFRDNTIDDYKRLFYTYLKLYLPSLFIVEDKISMAFSLESRTPLCDNELLQLALSIPLSQKLTNFELKHVPRVSMKDKLPGFIYHLPKRGFPTPIKRWFKNELKGFVKSFILDNYKEIDYFKKSKVEKLINKFQNSSFTTPYDEIKAHRLWILLNLVIYNKIQRQRYQLN
jgi:asparagine synthase (glutamine-hydrolysing)